MEEKEIKFTRGDTYSFTFTLEGQLLDGAYFTCRNSKDGKILFQKSLRDGIELLDENKYRVRIAPEDTANLSVGGKYYYDLELHKGNDVLTPLKGKLKITYDITY